MGYGGSTQHGTSSGRFLEDSGSCLEFGGIRLRGYSNGTKNPLKGDDSVAKCLPCKQEDLSSRPQHPYKKLGVVTHACDPSTVGRDRQIPRAQWPASLTETVCLGSAKDLVPDNKVKSVGERHGKVAPAHTHIQISEHTCICTNASHPHTHSHTYSHTHPS